MRRPFYRESDMKSLILTGVLVVLGFAGCERRDMNERDTNRATTTNQAPEGAGAGQDAGDRS